MSDRTVRLPGVLGGDDAGAWAEYHNPPEETIYGAVTAMGLRRGVDAALSRASRRCTKRAEMRLDARVVAALLDVYESATARGAVRWDLVKAFYVEGIGYIDKNDVRVVRAAASGSDDA